MLLKTKWLDPGESAQSTWQGPFLSPGHFFQALAYKRHGGRPFDAIKEWTAICAKSPLGMHEGSDPDGGNLVPTQFVDRIFERMLRPTELLPYLNPIPMSSRDASWPVLKENSRADGSRHGGMQGYWQDEADQFAASRPTFRNVNLRAKKLNASTYVTEELLQDSRLLEEFIARAAPKELNFLINQEVINGLGGARPLGVLNSGSKITVAAVSGQGANTIVLDNILDMRKRIVPGQRAGMIWLYNQDAEDELLRLKVPSGYTVANSKVIDFDADGGLRICGRPALLCEQCQPLGTEGDLIAFAPEGYAAGVVGSIRQRMSLHVRFDYGEVAFTWTIRFDGQPFDDVALTPFKGSDSFSSIVTLSSTRT